MAARYEPDLVIMDVRLPDGSGIEACREIRAARPETRVVMLTSYPDEEAVLSAIIAGASGYLLKQVRGRDLVTRWRRSVAASRSLTRRSPRRSSSAFGASRPVQRRTSWRSLTAQERKILLLVAEGKTNKEIAADVFLSDKTVKNYVSSILSKLNLQRRAQAAAFVAKHHLCTRRPLAVRRGPIQLSQQPARGALGGEVKDRAVSHPAQGATRRCVPASDCHLVGARDDRAGEHREERGKRRGPPADLHLPAIVQPDHRPQVDVGGLAEGDERWLVADPQPQVRLVPVHAFGGGD